MNREAVLSAADVHDLLTPSPERALLLNKAYRAIVEDQDFIFGRDATPLPTENFYTRVDPATAPNTSPRTSVPLGYPARLVDALRGTRAGDP